MTKNFIPAWDGNLAYAIGLFVSDGHLSIDGRHLDFTSKDLELIDNFKTALSLGTKISKKTRDKSTDKKYYCVRFGYIQLYNFFLSLGIPQQKSKNIEKVEVPDRLFFDFVRGLLDGDGNICMNNHPESTHKQVKVRFASANKKFLEWLKVKLNYLEIDGGSISRGSNVWSLTFGKLSGKALINKMYSDDNSLRLTRKYCLAKIARSV